MSFYSKHQLNIYYLFVHDGKHFAGGVREEMTEPLTAEELFKSLDQLEKQNSTVSTS